jgi:chromate transporter
MNADLWLGLMGQFLLLSLLSIGGAITVAPDMHRLLVNEHHLLTDPQFTSSIAIAQASPGPNVLFVAVLGYQAAGLLGTAALMTAIMLPSTMLAFAATRWRHSRQEWLPVRAFAAGMAPVTIALLVSTGWLLSAPASHWHSWMLSAAAALLVWRTRLHLLWLIGTGAVLGALGWV